MSDGQLLEHFVARRDEAAFETLVRRHGPMVLGVCRRVLGNSHDAEDAFQATFLVLVRKAASLSERELLGNWLYGVAYRTALDARAAAIRRQVLERQVSPMPEPEAPNAADTWRELRPLLDQELNRLPEKYRLLVVLCDLEGQTQRDVARQLGIPTGTLWGRLTAARAMLARRLTRVGLTLSAGALTAALSQAADAACVPSPLLARAVEAAVAAEQGVAGVVSARVAALAKGALQVMLAKSVKVATAVLLAVGIVGALAVVVQADREAQGAAKILKLDARGRRVAWSPDGKTLAAVTKVETMFSRKGSAIRLWDVETGQMRKTLVEDAGGGLAFQQVAFSPDGKTIAATVSEEVILPNMRLIRSVVKVWDAKTLVVKQTLGDNNSHLVHVAFSPDGKRIAASDPSKKKVTLWSAPTGALERAVQTGQAQPWSLAFSPDSKTLVIGAQKGDGSGEVILFTAETGAVKHTLKLARFVNAVAFSPDGKMVAAGGGGDLVQLWDVEKGKPIVSLKGDRRGHRTIAFSPDSKIVAAGGSDGKVRLWPVPAGKPMETLQGHHGEIHAIAFSPDGKTLASVSQDETLRLWPVNQQAAGSK
jgi:RNA polymerase sigma factor (sigma-70 family)